MKFWIPTILLCLLIAPGRAALAEHRQQVSYDQILAQALTASPAIVQSDAELAAMLAEGIAVATLPNPELQAEIRPAVASRGTADRTELAASISQPLRLSYFSLRGEVSRAIERAARADQKLAILRLTQEIRLAYGKLWALDERRTELDQAKGRAARVARFLEEATKKGLMGAAESALFVAEQRRLEADRLGLEADRARAEGELLRLSSYPLPIGQIAPLPLPDLPKELAPDLQQSLPEVERATLMLDLAKTQVDLARKDSFPRFAPVIGYERTGEGTQYVGLGVTFELPLFDRNQAERLKREAEQRAAAAKTAYLKSHTFEREAALVLGSARAVEAQAAAYRQNVIPTLLHAVESHEKLLRAGQGAMLQLWQSQKELYEAQAKYLELWSEALARRVELTVILGKEM